MAKAQRSETIDLSGDDRVAVTSAEDAFALEVEAKLALPERLAEQIAGEIQAGRIPAGKRVREQDLAAMFDVSRGPVREALRILEGDGFVDIEPFRGAVVTKASEHEVMTAVEMQAALFGVAARIVAETANDESIGKLTALLDELSALAEDDSATAEQFTTVSLRTTWTLIQFAHSTSLSKSIRSLRRLTRPDRWILALATKAKQRRAVRQWTDLIEAIRLRNPGRAETLARARVRYIHRNTT